MLVIVKKEIVIILLNIVITICVVPFQFVEILCISDLPNVLSWIALLWSFKAENMGSFIESFPVFPFSCCLPCFPSLWSFPVSLPVRCSKCDSRSFMLVLLESSDLIWSKPHLFVFLVFHGISKAILQYYVTKEPYFPASSLHWLTCTSCILATNAIALCSDPII